MQSQSGSQGVERRLGAPWLPLDDRLCFRSHLPPLSHPAQASEEALDAAQQAAAIDSCVAKLASRFDARLGGFGPAPKFPRPSEINVMHHEYSRLLAVGDKEAAGEICRGRGCMSRGRPGRARRRRRHALCRNVKKKQ